MDSNRKILDFKRVWNPSETKLINTATVYDLEKQLHRHVNTNTKCVVIHCGTNDLDTKSPHQLACELDDIIGQVV